MEINPSKCQVISINNINNKVKPIISNYRRYHHILEHVHCAKYLGVYIDSKLAFKAHVDATVEKANSTHAFLANNIARYYIDVKQTAYTTYVRPIVEYASPVLDPHTKRSTNIIEMVQRR